LQQYTGAALMLAGVVVSQIITRKPTDNDSRATDR
jgi:predicted phage tail protein